MGENERQQRLIERVQEDERLRGDLEDTAAIALVQWASDQVARAAADPARPDDEVETEVQSIRRAARTAANSGEGDPQQLIALANEALAKQAGSVGSSLGSILAKQKEQQEQNNTSNQSNNDERPRVVLQGDASEPKREISQSVLGSTLNTAVQSNASSNHNQETPAISITPASQDVVAGSLRRAPTRANLTSATPNAEEQPADTHASAEQTDTPSEISSSVPTKQTSSPATSNEPEASTTEPTTGETNNSSFWRRNSIWSKIRRGLKGK